MEIQEGESLKFTVFEERKQNFTLYTMPNLHDVLQHAELPSLTRTPSRRRLGWLGHVSRIPDSHNPRQVFYGKLTVVRRSHDAPKLRYKNICTSSRQDFSTSQDAWEEPVKDQVMWRAPLHKGGLSVLEKMRTQLETKRYKCKRKLDFATQTLHAVKAVKNPTLAETAMRRAAQQDDSCPLQNHLRQRVLLCKSSHIT